VPGTTKTFFKAHCYDCHNASTKKGGLDLTALKFDTSNAKTFETWVKIHDRVRDGEMPPPAMERIDASRRKPFLTVLAASLGAADAARMRREGRSTWRRMNRLEYENTLRDLLGTPWLQVKEMLPEDGQAHRFNKVGTALDVSYVQMSRYLAAAEYALRESMAKHAERPTTTTTRHYARAQRSYINDAVINKMNGSPERSMFLLVGNAHDTPAYTQTGPITVGDKDPARREEESVGVVASSYEPIEPKFQTFKATVSGRYKIRIRARSFWSGPESAERWWKPSRTDLSKGRTREPVTVYSESYPRQLRRLGSFDVVPEASVSEMDFYLLKGETIRPDPVRLFRSRPPAFRNPLAQPDGQPGVAFHWLEVEGPIYDAGSGAGQRLMFGDLPLTTGANGRVEVVPRDPEVDAERLLRGGLARTGRR
jgi:hypothetical protein